MQTRHRAPPFTAPRSLLALALSFAACFGISALGGAITAEPVKTWYPLLAKPALTPPDLAFPIVWTALYALMAIAAWRVWRQASRTGAGLNQARAALLLFALQLVLNLGWSWLFFGQQMIGWALAEIGLLWLAIVACIVTFARHDRIAALLLTPYLLWVSFAAYLTFAIWQLN
ncbi:tryptophan-rich sensory protein [Ferrovibrio terrae]|uniref:Tryptophan-rich sensory protein n=1 Tax=Ferrovibrio terrae TaxID=2594003 RepID=A0A516H205_9PROT|nr:TspO/MBR family protein [Ferrovibrio terrae]QDO97811.1 tryptophan-rich sensory protein [Ferrovibrio terrae]